MELEGRQGVAGGRGRGRGGESAEGQTEDHQVQEKEEGEGDDGPPVQEHYDQGEAADSEDCIGKEERREPEKAN